MFIASGREFQAMLLDKSDPSLLRGKSVKQKKNPAPLRGEKSLQGVELGHIRTGNLIPGLSPKALKHLV